MLFNQVIIPLLIFFILFVIVAGIKILLGWIALIIWAALILTGYGFFYIISQGNNTRL